MDTENLVRKKSEKCCYIFTWRQGTMLNAILQATVHWILTVLMLLTIKITFMMREKQIADLEDHGADDDHFWGRDDVQDKSDLMRLWEAKMHNDAKINITILCVIFNTIYATACLTTIYGAVVRSHRIIGMSVSFCLCTLTSLGFILFFGSSLYMDSYELKRIKNEGIRLSAKTCFEAPASRYIAIGLCCYFILALIGHGITMKHYFKLLESGSSLSRCESTNSSINEIIDDDKTTLKHSWSANPLKNIIYSIKYIHGKINSTKPTAV